MFGTLLQHLRSAIPARRATRINPLETLQAELRVKARAAMGSFHGVPGAGKPGTRQG